MLSRIADSLFWMNRYMERGDGLLRTITTHYILGMDNEGPQPISWGPVLKLFASIKQEKLVAIETDTAAAVQALLTADENENSLKAMIGKARENARGAQDHLTKEVWEQINAMFHSVNNTTLNQQLQDGRMMEAVEELSNAWVFYAGIIDITMPRGQGWYFMSLGRYVERCLQTIALTQQHLKTLPDDKEAANDVLAWRQLLLSVSGYEQYLKNYRSGDHGQNVLHHLLVNQNFSRSVVYCLRRMNHYLEHLVDVQQHAEHLVMVRSFGRLYASVRYADPAGLQPDTIGEFLDDVRKGVLDFGRQLERHFFSHS